MHEIVDAMNARLRDSGILPLKIRLPRAGAVHQFSRLMATGEPLALTATFVNVRVPGIPLRMVGLTLLAVGCLGLYCKHRAGGQPGQSSPSSVLP